MSLNLRDTEKEKRISHEMNTCKYFNGIQNKYCAAGVKYENVRDEEVAAPKYPCINPASTCCSLVMYHIREEAERREKEIIEALNNVGVARAAILEVSKDRKNYSSSIDCPVCQKGKLSYSIASNGHIHACCSQLNCVRWME
jgi:hypothetical protein